MHTSTKTIGRVRRWTKGELPGRKPSLQLKEIRVIRMRLQRDQRTRELASFKLVTVAAPRPRKAVREDG